MTDKEKEAIKTMQHWIEYEKANKEKINKADELIEIQETVLSLVQTQQEEIFKLQAKVDRLKVARENWKKTYKQAEKEEEKYKYLYQKALDNTIKADRDNLKKDKIIDEMARTFYDTESLCVNDEIKVDCKHNCTDCIKQYFTNKVEKENKKWDKD